MSTTIRHTFLLLMLGCCFLFACSNSPSPVAVSGTVSIDGQPLPSGKVVLEPITDGQRRDADVANGNFALPESEGVYPGQEFKVTIKAFRKTGRKYPNANMGASYEEVEQYLPEQYNSASTLQVTISPRAAQNHFEFDLDSQAP